MLRSEDSWRVFLCFSRLIKGVDAYLGGRYAGLERELGRWICRRRGLWSSCMTGPPRLTATTCSLGENGLTALRACAGCHHHLLLRGSTLSLFPPATGVLLGAQGGDAGCAVHCGGAPRHRGGGGDGVHEQHPALPDGDAQGGGSVHATPSHTQQGTAQNAAQTSLPLPSLHSLLLLQSILGNIY